MPLLVMMWTFCSQPINAARNTNDRTKASAACQPGADALLKLELAAEQDHRAFGAVGLIVQAAARHGEDLARLEGLGLAVAGQAEVALQDHGTHVERVAVLGIHLRAR